MLKQFPIDEYRPQGWLKEQLQIQADGLAGNLDKVWGDVRDSAWIGGNREGWERVPYWLDGFLPLAWLLDDEDKKERAERYIRGILAGQCEDGWICPVPSAESAKYDLWACFLIGKVLALYVDLTGDEAAEKALYRAMACLLRKLENGEAVIFGWAKTRWFEALIPLMHLYERTKEEWIVQLAHILKERGEDWAANAERWKEPINEWTQQTHIVNLGMMLKYAPLYAEFSGENVQNAENTVEYLWKTLQEYNGTAVGTTAGDECLAGLVPTRGTELCSVVELMYSFEWLYALTGNSIWLERLERTAFNALPATFLDDMWTHQYDQQVNQASAVPFPGKSHFGTNSSDAHIFGLEPSYGCCTANMGQGFPKLAMNVFLRDGDAITVALPLPAELKTTVHGVPFTVCVQSEYPFRHKVQYVITAEKPVTAELRFRVPAWSKSVTVNGRTQENTGILIFPQEWSGETVIAVEYRDEPHFIFRPFGNVAVEYGAMVYAVPVPFHKVMREYIRRDVERKFPYCDYELVPESGWGFGYSSDSFTVEERAGDGFPFSSASPRIVLKTQVTPIAWEHEEGYRQVPARTPATLTPTGEPTETVLYPYGCAKLRMTEIPKI